MKMVKIIPLFLACLTLVVSCSNNKHKNQKLTSGKVFVDLGAFKDSVAFHNLVDTLNDYEVIKSMVEKICIEAKRDLKYGATFKPAGPVWIKGACHVIIPKELSFENIDKAMKKKYGNDAVFKLSVDEWGKAREKIKDSLSKLYNVKTELIDRKDTIEISLRFIGENGFGVPGELSATGNYSKGDFFNFNVN